jgi:hypothetical protein
MRSTSIPVIAIPAIAAAPKMTSAIGCQRGAGVRDEEPGQAGQQQRLPAVPAGQHARGNRREKQWFPGAVRSFSPRWVRQLGALTPATPDPLAARFIGDLRTRGVHVPSDVRSQLTGGGAASVPG